MVTCKQACSGSMERAVDWLFSHAGDLDAAVATASDPGAAAPAPGAPETYCCDTPAIRVRV